MLKLCPYCGVERAFWKDGISNEGIQRYKCTICKRHTTFPKGQRLGKTRPTTKPLVKKITNKNLLELLDQYFYLRENQINISDLPKMIERLEKGYGLSWSKARTNAIVLFYLHQSNRPEDLDKILMERKGEKYAISNRN